MTPQEKTEIRDKRVMAALNMERPDRTPIYLLGQMYYNFIDPKMVIADYWRKPKLVDEYLLKAYQLPVIDEIDFPPMISGLPMDTFLGSFGAMWFAKMKIPGRDLPENALWQIDEQGPMTVEDYDTVLKKGWAAVKQELLNRIGFDPMKLPPPDPNYMQEIAGKVAALGKTSIGMAGGLLPFAPFETLSGARKLGPFFRDLHRIPDKVRAVLDIVEDEEVQNTVKAIKQIPGIYGFIGGSRAGSDFISPKIFEKFYFSYFRKLVPVMQKLNVKTWLHMDGVWDGFLHFFADFPKGQCIWDPDHLTSNEKMKEILGPRMCITGNVPPGLLSIGTPDECYNYTKKNIELFGKSGFIVAAACTVPPNAKFENIKAVISATLDA